MVELNLKKRRKRRPKKPDSEKDLMLAYRTAKLWTDPEYIAKQKASRTARGQHRRENPELYRTRRGCPDGITPIGAKRMWTKARRKAEEVHKIMVEQGKCAPLPDTGEGVEYADGKTVVVPLTDDQKASAALKEACVIAFGPMNQKDKLSALRMVLDFTKAKPVQRQEHKFSNAEEWLASVVGDNESEASEGGSGAEASA